MRRGIGLRGYAGIDPLNEFRREAFKLYEELRGFISKQVANTIFRVQAQAARQSFPMPIPAQFSGQTSADGDGSRMDTITPVEGGHVHTDGTFHADNPAQPTPAAPAAPAPVAAGAAKGASSSAAAAAVLPGLAAQPRRGIQYHHGDEPASGNGAMGGGQASPSGVKVGRNDPCWCGSGKKFKRCHGA
ncbi:MAG TPA: SEC-C metal-binding domain-containing protein, partial [Candidatus Limnocylindrales bacterium]|nr:SEC-C metal-binding domain-containing protein [Candidatus Limnocylindrales bacterium]